AHVIVTPLLDETGKSPGISETTHDITERKRAEEDLHSYADRLKLPSRRLVEVQQAERTPLARELHDRDGQDLTALGRNPSSVAAHSHAEVVELAIPRGTGLARLGGRDNGVDSGAERSEGANRAAGWGLWIRRERAEGVGAQLPVKAGLATGVQVLVEYHRLS